MLGPAGSCDKDGDGQLDEREIESALKNEAGNNL